MGQDGVAIDGDDQRLRLGAKLFQSGEDHVVQAGLGAHAKKFDQMPGRGVILPQDGGGATLEMAPGGGLATGMVDKGGPATYSINKN